MKSGNRIRKELIHMIEEDGVIVTSDDVFCG